MTEQDRVDGGEQKDWQLWSGALGVQQDFFFFFAEMGSWSGEGQEAEGSHAGGSQMACLRTSSWLFNLSVLQCYLL